MAQFTSKYSEYGFYVKGSVKKFNNGRYSTDDKDEIAVLDTLVDVVRIKDVSKAEDAADKAPKGKPSSAK
jgi:hypothetical protein